MPWALIRVLEPLVSSHAPQLVIALWTSGIALLVIPDRRLAILALLGQRLLVAILLLPTIGLPLVTTHVIGSIAIVLVCSLAEWRLRKSTPALTGDAARSTRRPFWGLTMRLASGSLGALLAYALVQRISVAWLPSLVALAAACLIVNGLLVLLLAESALWTGLGVLAFVDGTRLVHALWPPDPLAWGLWSVCDVCVALAASFLRGSEAGQPTRPVAGEQL